MKKGWHTRYVAGLMLALIFGSLPARSTFLEDPWHVMGEVAPSATQSMLQEGGVSATCPQGGVGAPLSLFEAIERTLCANPKTRGAWADIKASAAALGVARAAYLPTLNGSMQYIGEHVRSDVLGQPAMDSHHNEHVSTQTLSLNWVLFDFGGRDADLDSAKKLLVAAEANLDVALQTAFINAAKDYYAAETGLARLQAMQYVEQVAENSFKAASARMERGATGAADMLQAKTAYIQATYNRVKAESTYRSAQGVLAVDMGLPAQVKLTLPPPNSVGNVEPPLSSAIGDLIEEAQRRHPTILAAQAQWESAQAKAALLKAQGLPTLSIIAQSSRNNQPTSVGLGQPELPAMTRDNYLGVKLDVPLFEGQGRTYRIRQAEEQAESQREAMHDAQRQVASAIWSNYQELLANTQNFTTTSEGLEVAQKAVSVMQGRYRGGMGNILELLNAQSALAKAEEQHIEAQTDWYTSRLQLAASLGNIGLISVTTDEE